MNAPSVLTGNDLGSALGWIRRESKTGNNPCACLVPTDKPGILLLGCGSHTHKTFTQGHDAKTKRVLQQSFRSGVTDVTIQRAPLADGKKVPAVHTTVTDLASIREWETFLAAPPARPSRSSMTPEERVHKLQQDLEKAQAELDAASAAASTPSSPPAEAVSKAS